MLNDGFLIPHPLYLLFSRRSNSDDEVEDGYDGSLEFPLSDGALSADESGGGGGFGSSSFRQHRTLGEALFMADGITFEEDPLFDGSSGMRRRSNSGGTWEVVAASAAAAASPPLGRPRGFTATDDGVGGGIGTSDASPPDLLQQLSQTQSSLRPGRDALHVANSMVRKSLRRFKSQEELFKDISQSLTNRISLSALSDLVRERSQSAEVRSVDDSVEALVDVHARDLIAQELAGRGLDPAWLDTVVALASRSVSGIDPNIALGDVMDCRAYVKTLCVPGGSMEDSFFVDGVAIVKNVAHKKMRRHIDEPAVLILGSAIEYHRGETRFASFDKLQAEEKQYLRIQVAKIAALQPGALPCGACVCVTSHILERVRVCCDVVSLYLVRVLPLLDARFHAASFFMGGLWLWLWLWLWLLRIAQPLSRLRRLLTTLADRCSLFLGGQTFCWWKRRSRGWRASFS